MKNDEKKENMENMENENTPQNIDEKEDAAWEDDLFSQFSDGGYTAHLRRITPLYAAGYCGDIPLDKTVSLAEIAETFGGRKYHCRITNEHGRYVGRRMIEIADVPKRNGVPWLQSGVPANDEKAKPVLINPSETNQSAQYFEGLQMVLDRQAEMIERLSGELLLQAKEKTGSVSQINDLASAIEAIRSLSDTLSPPPIATTGTEGQIMEMIKAYMEMNKASREPRPEPRRYLTPLPVARPPVVVPLSQPQYPPPPPVQAVQAQPEQEPEQEPEISDPDQLLALLQNSDPDLVAETLARAFNSFPQEKQIVIMKKLSEL